jgi:hypothetical protein
MAAGRPDHMTPRFSDEQKAAIVRAVVDGGVTQLHAIELAKQGQLEGVGPFSMSRGHLSTLVQRERKGRLVAAGIETRAAGARQRCARRSRS